MKSPALFIARFILLCIASFSVVAQDKVDPRLQSPWQIAMLVYNQHRGPELSDHQRAYLQSIFDNSEVQARFGPDFNESAIQDDYYPSPKQIANFYVSWFAVNYLGDKQELWQAIVEWESIKVSQQDIDSEVAYYETRPRYDPSLEAIEFMIHERKFLMKYPGRKTPVEINGLRTPAEDWNGRSSNYSNVLGFREHAVMGAWMENYITVVVEPGLRN